MTSNALFFYSIGMIGYGPEIFYLELSILCKILRLLWLTRYSCEYEYYFEHNTFKILGLGGLALATSISALLCTGMLFVSLRKDWPLWHENTTISFIKI